MEIIGQGWRKSSYTGNGGSACVEVSAWHKSSYSGNGGGNCVEVAQCPHVVAVRDSKDPHGPVLPLDPEDWREFTGRVKAGRHDLT